MLIVKSRLNLNSLKFKCAWINDFNNNFIFYGNIVVSRLRFFFYCRTKNIWNLRESLGNTKGFCLKTLGKPD